MRPASYVFVALVVLLPSSAIAPRLGQPGPFTQPHTFIVAEGPVNIVRNGESGSNFCIPDGTSVAFFLNAPGTNAPSYFGSVAYGGPKPPNLACNVGAIPILAGECRVDPARTVSCTAAAARCATAHLCYRLTLDRYGTFAMSGTALPKTWDSVGGQVWRIDVG